MSIPSDRSATAFVGFVFNGEHSIADYNIYRTSDGDRYNHNPIPQLEDKTAPIPGGHGQYFFKSTYKTRQFSVPIAFDDLTEEKFYKLESWLDGLNIHQLSFDERPNVTYSAKVTGTPQLKFICFDEKKEVDGVLQTVRVYKGEGTIQFTCYYPFGYEGQTITIPKKQNNITEENISIESEWPVSLKIFTNASVPINTTFYISNILSITIKEAGVVEWDTNTGLVLINGKPGMYEGKSYGTIPPGDHTVSRIENYEYTISWNKLTA